MNKQDITMRITKFMLIETSSNYKAVPKRTYNLNATSSTLGRLDSIITPGGRFSGKMINEAELAVNVPDLINISPGILGIAEIPNGWNTTRLRFLMEVVEERTPGQMLISYLQGFSEYHDPSLSGLLDPNMTFHINSIVNVVRTLTQSNIPGMPPVVHNRVSSMYNVISDVFGNSRFEEVQDINSKIKLCRPTDIASNLMALDMVTSDNSLGYTVMNNMTDTIQEHKPATSFRGNNNPYKYMATTLNGFTSCKAATDVGHSFSDIISSASGVLREPDISQCAFIDALIMLRNYGPQSPSSFTLGELKFLSPGTLETATQLITRDISDYDVNNPSSMLTTEDTADMIQPSAEAYKSAAVAHSITGIMLENMVTRLGFSATNYTGQPDVVITDMNSFMDGIDPVMFAERIKTGIYTSIIPNVSDSNLSTFELFVTADLLGDITIGIKLNSNNHVVMRYPAFADSLYSPVVTNVASNNILINDFQELLDHTVLSKF